MTSLDQWDTSSGSLAWLTTRALQLACLQLSLIIIQQIVTLSKYGHDALDICHP